jgi:HD-GYP domain-containing protein (c-di-GMP phosphodiesterase class II)
MTEDRTDAIERSQLRRDVRLQTRGKQIVSNLYMLVRNVKIHSPDNDIFLKPIEQLREAINNVIAAEGRLSLQAIETHVYLNNTQLKFDFAALETVRYMTKEFESRDIGGFTSDRPITTQEIRDFLFLFTNQYRGAASEKGADGHELDALQLARFAKVKEILDKLQEEPDLDQQVDRKKYLLTVYARAIVFMRVYLEKARGGDRSLPLAKAGRLVQEFVDLSGDEKTQFLGMTTTRADSEYLEYHSVNVCLLSIVLGRELGLDKRQLHDLGMAAIFSQVGLADLPEPILGRRGRLSEEERRLIDLYPLRSAKAILATRGLDQTTMSRIVAAYESHVDYAVPRKRPDGEVELVLPKVGLGPFGKIIAIADCYDALTSRRPFREAYGPPVALALMASELKHRFDPALLRVFMKAMAIQPIRILDSGGQSLTVA